MSEMTTQEMVDELENGCRGWSATHRYEIAARLKAQEDALRWYQQQCADVNRRGDLGDNARNAIASDAGKRARAILDAAREVEK